MQDYPTAPGEYPGVRSPRKKIRPYKIEEQDEEALISVKELEETISLSRSEYEPFLEFKALHLSRSYDAWRAYAKLKQGRTIHQTKARNITSEIRKLDLALVAMFRAKQRKEILESGSNSKTANLARPNK